MKPLRKILTAGLLFFLGVEAAKDKVNVSPWVSRDCSGHLAGKAHAITQGNCKEIIAQSLAFHVPGKRKYLTNWLNRVNSGLDTCYVSVFATSGCNFDDPTVQSYQVPAEFEKCIAFPQGVRSVKFHCEGNGLVASVVSYSTITTPTEVTATSYTIEASDRKASGAVFTITTDVTTAVPVTFSPSPTRSPPPRHILEARAKYGMSNHWYLHPWGGYAVCFKCWLRHKGDKDKFECESSDETGSLCTAPALDRNTVIIMMSTTLPPTTTTVVLGLEKRKEHMVVDMTNPANGQRTCGKVVWKHPGKHNQKLQIKGPHKCKGNDFKADPQQPTTTTTTTVPGPTVSLVEEVQVLTVTMKQ